MNILGTLTIFNFDFFIYKKWKNGFLILECFEQIPKKPKKCKNGPFWSIFTFFPEKVEKSKKSIFSKVTMEYRIIVIQVPLSTKTCIKILFGAGKVVFLSF